MLYKLLHKIFGWDYIHWQNLRYGGIARLHIDREGRAYFWKDKSFKMLEHLDEKINGNIITWLTCHPSKYTIKYTK